MFFKSLCNARRFFCLGCIKNLHPVPHLTPIQGIKNKLTVRGVVRGGSLALCAMNVVGCGLAYTFGKREKEEKKT